MRTLIEYVIAFLDLAEAEGRAFRSGTGNLVFGLVILIAGGLLLVAGIGLCISGMYAGFLRAFGGSAVGAGLMTGVITLLIAGIVLWIGKLVTKR